MDRVDYQTEPSRYKHWKLKFDGPVATLLADFDEDAGLRPGYKLKLNSYDLGVDIELNDAVNRIRFERPEVRVVVIMSARERVFCSGANIFMLGVSSHAWKVNFCKFTNETRNGLEDSSRYEGLKFLAAVNGSCAGGGYELALACDEIILIDDRSSAVSLPEVPLLGVLPGTGGLTRLTDKRHVRHDLADVFCTTSEGVRGEKAVAWRLVDAIAKPAQFQAKVQERAQALAASSDRPSSAKGVALTPIERTIEADALSYSHVKVTIDRGARAATFVIKGPSGAQPQDVAAIEAEGANWYPLALARELEDAILSMRTNEPDIGVWLMKTEGEPEAVLAMDATLHALQRPLAGARNHRLSAPHIQPARRHLAQPVRARGRGLLLRWLASRNRAGLRPDLPSRRRRRACAQDRAQRGELRRLPDGERPESPRSAASTTRGRRSSSSRPTSASRSTPRPPSPLASPPAFPTTSTGRTKSASRSKNARR